MARSLAWAIDEAEFARVKSHARLLEVQLDEARRLIALFQLNEAERIRELDDIVDASHKTSQVISLVDANWRQQVVDLKAALATSNRRESSLEAEALQLRRDCAAKDDTIHRLGVQLTALEADVRALRAAKSDALAAMQDAQRRWEKAAGQFDRERLSLEADRAALVRSLTVADSRQRAEASTVMSRAASQSSDLARRLQRSEAACDRLRTLNASLAAEVARLRVGDTRRGSASAALAKASTSDGESWRWQRSLSPSARRIASRLSVSPPRSTTRSLAALSELSRDADSIQRDLQSSSAKFRRSLTPLSPSVLPPSPSRSPSPPPRGRSPSPTRASLLPGRRARSSSPVPSTRGHNMSPSEDTSRVEPAARSHRAIASSDIFVPSSLWTPDARSSDSSSRALADEFASPRRTAVAATTGSRLRTEGVSVGHPSLNGSLL